MDRGKNQCMARAVPPIAGSSRAPALHLLRLLLPRVLLDNTQEAFLKQALAKLASLESPTKTACAQSPVRTDPAQHPLPLPGSAEPSEQPGIEAPSKSPQVPRCLSPGTHF